MFITVYSFASGNPYFMLLVTSAVLLTFGDKAWDKADTDSNGEILHAICNKCYIWGHIRHTIQLGTLITHFMFSVTLIGPFDTVQFHQFAADFPAAVKYISAAHQPMIKLGSI